MANRRICKCAALWPASDFVSSDNLYNLAVLASQQSPQQNEVSNQHLARVQFNQHSNPPSVMTPQAPAAQPVIGHDSARLSSKSSKQQLLKLPQPTTFDQAFLKAAIPDHFMRKAVTNLWILPLLKRCQPSVLGLPPCKVCNQSMYKPDRGERCEAALATAANASTNIRSYVINELVLYVHPPPGSIHHSLRVATEAEAYALSTNENQKQLQKTAAKTAGGSSQPTLNAVPLNAAQWAYQEWNRSPG